MDGHGEEKGFGGEEYGEKDFGKTKRRGMVKNR